MAEEKRYTFKASYDLYDESDPEGSEARAEMRVVYRRLDAEQLLEVEQRFCADPLQGLITWGREELKG